MDRRYHDADWLRTQYHDEGMTQAEIAEACDVHEKTIQRWMKRLGVDTRDPVGEDHPMHGKERSEETKRKIARTLTGREVSEETRRKISTAQRGQVLAEETKRKISESLSGRSLSMETRMRMSKSTAGKANPNWKGGYGGRYGASWSPVREWVRERDVVCQECGDDGDETRLEVHHIVPVRRFRESEEFEIEDAHDTDNLVLLCSRCHSHADHGQLDLEHGLDDDAVPSPK